MFCGDITGSRKESGIEQNYLVVSECYFSRISLRVDLVCGCVSALLLNESCVGRHDHDVKLQQFQPQLLQVRIV